MAVNVNSSARLLTCLLILSMLAACTGLPQRPTSRSEPATVGTVLNGRTLLPIPVNNVVQRLQAARLILLGVATDHPTHAVWSEQIIKIATRYDGIDALGVTMIDFDHQADLHQAATAAGADIDGLVDALAWTSEFWPNYQAYTPALAASIEHGAELVASGLSAAQADKIRVSGIDALPLDLVQRLGLTGELDDTDERQLLSYVRTAYCPKMDIEAERLATLLRTQSALMVDRLTTLAGTGRGILLAEPVMINSHWGAMAVLDQRDLDAEPIAVALVAANDEPTIRSLAGTVDLIWLTHDRATAKPDPCAPVLEAQLLLKTAHAG